MADIYIFYIFAIYSTYFQKLMKQTRSHLKSMTIGLLLISSFCSCVDNERNLSSEEETKKIPKEEFFDYDMNQAVAVDIDYTFGNQTRLSGSYRILFEIYDQNPLELDESVDAITSWKKKNIEPLYRGATDQNGKYSGEMAISANISKVWLYSDYLGTVSPLELTIEGNRISFNQDAYIKAKQALAASKTRGITTNQHTYLDDWHLLPGADWDENGRPNNLEDGLNIPPADILYNIKHVFRKKTVKVDGKNEIHNISYNYPEFFDGSIAMTSDIPIVKPTEVSLVFVNSSAAWYNTVGYYTYKTGTTPDVNTIKKTIAFPNVSPVYKTLGKGALVCGEAVKLKYWNETTEKYEDKFPEGVTIGWCLQGMGFKSKLTGNSEKIGDIVKGMGPRYSTRAFNKDNQQRTVSLRDKTSGKIVAIGFEDNIDMDYCDALFYITTSEKDAADPNLPELPPSETVPGNKDLYTITYSGTLTFEDLWPKEGDYDMNDIIVRYTSTLSRMVLDNRIYEIEDKFTVEHCGGYLRNGFGYQFHNLSNSNIKSVKITPEDNPTSSFMAGQRVEPGQTHPTILLFDNMTVFKGIADESKRQYTVKVQLDGINEKEIVPPYNPFIFISSNEGRGKEVHLVNYPPTDKADVSLFGTGKDLSRPAEGLYYVSIDMMPFAINMPVSDEIERELITKLKDSKNEGKRIDELYPRFTSWAKSNGTKDKDWYIQK